MRRWILKTEQPQKIVTKRIVFLVTIFLFVLFLAPHNVLAQQTADTREALGLTQIENEISLGSEDIRLTIAKIIRIFLGFLGITALVLMLYAGYTIMTSAGDANQVDKGKKILINAAVGLAVVLSAYAITQFFITKLGEATGFRAGGSGNIASQQSFLASGALGRIVRDHYPFRDQRDVPRNTRISVTFNEALLPSSVFNDTNANGAFGDCINLGLLTFDWNTDCDRLNTGAIIVRELDENGAPVGAALDMVGLASVEDGQVFTIMLRPLQPLGNDTDPVLYSVDLTNNIFKANGTTRMFALDRDNHYEWKFLTGIEFDFSPPVVTSVYPVADTEVARNSIIQVNFSEPMDPTVTQGRAGSFYHIILQNRETGGVPQITGTWRIANGYRTVEFVSDQACGENSCGEIMYCLPSNCALGDTACSETHSTLIRTAGLISASSFEAIPFSGVTDMAGNALNGDMDNVADGKPVPIGTNTILGTEQNSDNYLWNFEVQNVIDRSAPYVREVAPGIDQEDVAEDAVNTILFNKQMWNWTLGGITLTEKINSVIPALWYRTSTEIDPSTGETLVSIGHRAFGPKNEDAYYFVSIDSTVKSLNQNCIYPGRGPYSAVRGDSPLCTCNEDANGVLTCDANCVSVTFDANQDTGCVQTANAGDRLKGDIPECLSTMDTLSPL